jgi:xylose isomerase
MLAEVGAWGVNLHDNDLVPIDATVAEGDRIVRSLKAACEANGIVVPMATASLFFHPVFRDGIFTANDPEVRACCSKNHAGDGHWRELGAKIFVLWGGRRASRPTLAVARMRRSSDCAKLSTIFANTTSSAGTE